MKRVRDNILSVIFKESYLKNIREKTEFKHHIRISFSLFIKMSSILSTPSVFKALFPNLSHLTAVLCAVSYENEFVLTLSMLKRFCLFHQVQKTVVHSPLLLFLNVPIAPPPSHFRGKQSSVL